MATQQPDIAHNFIESFVKNVIRLKKFLHFFYSDVTLTGLSNNVQIVHCAKSVGLNQTSFDIDARISPNNISLDRVAVPPREAEIWGSELPQSLYANSVQTDMELAALPSSL